MAIKKRVTVEPMKALDRFPATEVPGMGGCSIPSLISRLPRTMVAWTVGVVLAMISLGGMAQAQTTALLSVAVPTGGELVSENGGTATFEVTLTGTVSDSNTAITVVCSIDFDREHSEEADQVDKDAGDDDEDNTNDHRRQVTITPSAGRTGRCAFDLIDDTYIEPDKFLKVVLAEDTASPFPDEVGIDESASNNEATITITSDERGTIRAFEGQSNYPFPLFERGSDYLGTYAGFESTVSLRPDAPATAKKGGYMTATVTFSGEISDADFVGLTGMKGTLVGFPDREFDPTNPSLDEFYSLYVFDDDEIEGFEAGTMTLTLSDPRWSRSLAFEPAVVHFHIVDNDGAGAVLFVHSLNGHTTAAEAKTASVHLVVSPQLDTATVIPMVVTVDGASAADWTVTNLVAGAEGHSVELPAAEDSVAMKIAATQDLVWEAGRTETVTIGIDVDNLPDGFTVATGVHPQSLTITLQDRDEPPQLQVAVTGSGTDLFQEGNATYQESFTVTIPDDRAVFSEDRTLTLAVGPSSEATLDDIALDSSATTAVVLPAGERSVTAVWTFGIADDDVVEGAETLTIRPTIDGPEADQVDIPEFTLTNPLLDNDTATVGFASTTGETTVMEDGTVTLMVTLSGTITRDVTVPWVGSGVDAAELSAGSLSGTLTFTPDGARSQDIAFTIADDSDPEATEVLIVTLQTPTGALSGSVSVDPANSTHDVVIAVNDGATERQVTDVAVTSPAPNSGFYGVASTITVTVTFDGNVTVTGTPTIGLMIGDQVRTAEYSGDTDSEVTELTFGYSVGAGVQDHDGVGVVANSLSVGGGDSISGVGTEVFTNLRHVGITNLAGHAVDTLTPTVTAVDVQSRPIRGSTYGVHERIRVRVSFSEMVTVVGAPTLNLRIGGQDVAATLHTNSFPAEQVWFHHEVRASDTDVGGLNIPEDPFTLPSGASVRDVAANEADLSQAAGSDLAAHQVDGTVLATEAADIDGDNQVQYNDAIILYSALQFADLLEINASSPSSSGVAFRQTFIAPHVLGGQAGAIGTILQSASAAADFADARNSVLDVSGDGELDGNDAAILYYAWRFPELVGRDRSGAPPGFEQIRLAMFGAHFPSVDEAGARAMLARANAFLGR